MRSVPKVLASLKVLKRANAQLDSGIVRACPFFVIGMRSVRFSNETSRQCILSISPRRIAVPGAI